MTKVPKIIWFHNYLSVNTNFSKEDEEITKRLQKCGEILDIELVDHIVAGDDDKYFALNFSLMQFKVSLISVTSIIFLL